MESGMILSEWTDERESGAIDYRLVVTGSDDVPSEDAWLEARYRGENFAGEEVLAQDWDEEELDDAGFDLLKHIPVIVREVIAAERKRVREELLKLAEKWMANGGTSMLDATRGGILKIAIDRICPE